jgi:hypothetical protein
MLHTLSNNGDNLTRDYWQDSGECLALVTSRSAAKVISKAQADNVTRDVFTLASQRCGYVGELDLRGQERSYWDLFQTAEIIFEIILDVQKLKVVIYSVLE